MSVLTKHAKSAGLQMRNSYLPDRTSSLGLRAGCTKTGVSWTQHEEYDLQKDQDTKETLGFRLNSPVEGAALYESCLLLYDAAYTEGVPLPAGWELLKEPMRGWKFVKHPWPCFVRADWRVYNVTVQFHKPDFKLRGLGVTAARILVKDILHGAFRESLVEGWPSRCVFVAIASHVAVTHMQQCNTMPMYLS